MAFKVYSWIVIVFTLVFIACSASGEHEAVNSTEIKSLSGNHNGIVVDVRTPEEFREGHLAQTDYHIDFLDDGFENKLDELDKDQTYYLYCRTGNRSGQARQVMKEKGFISVYNIGGYQDLLDAGLHANDESDQSKVNE